IAFSLLNSLPYEINFPWLQLIPIALFIIIFGFEILINRYFPLKKTGLSFFDYAGLSVSVLVIIVIVFLTEGFASPFKILFLPVILLYTLRFGLRFGLLVSTVSVASLTIQYAVFLTVGLPPVVNIQKHIGADI